MFVSRSSPATCHLWRGPWDCCKYRHWDTAASLPCDQQAPRRVALHPFQVADSRQSLPAQNPPPSLWPSPLHRQEKLCSYLSCCLLLSCCTNIRLRFLPTIVIPLSYFLSLHIQATLSPVSFFSPVQFFCSIHFSSFPLLFQICLYRRSKYKGTNKKGANQRI